jgi:MULE transposase domain
MPLLHFIGVSYINTSSSIAFYFIAEETDLIYHRAVADFKRLVIGDSKIEFFLIDNNKALKNALTSL